MEKVVESRNGSDSDVKCREKVDSESIPDWKRIIDAKAIKDGENGIKMSLPRAVQKLLNAEPGDIISMKIILITTPTGDKIFERE